MSSENPYSPEHPKPKELVFTNPRGLTVYRFVIPTTTVDSVKGSGLLVTNGIEEDMRAHVLNPFDIDEHVVMPEMHLPVRMSDLSIEALQAALQEGKNNFADSTGLIVVSEIPWKKLLSGEITLYANTALRGHGERVVRLLPRRRRDGSYVIRRVVSRYDWLSFFNRPKLNPGLADRFTGRSLNTAKGEFTIAAPNPHATSIYDESEDLRPHLAGSAVMLVRIDDSQSGEVLYSGKTES